jgi:hypothetical protein
VTALPEIPSPYPGLRAFRRDEADRYFGRDDSISAMVDRLAANRFLAVLGSSGTGKSSLVRTGLLQALEFGLMGTAGSSWRIVDFRPGTDPLMRLSYALLRGASPHPTPAPLAQEARLLRAMLARGPRSIVEWCHAGHVPSGTNLLLLVDQFEELFVHQDYAESEDADIFVALLLQSVAERVLPIYVVITMRSEYVGACAQIEGLAEAINSGMFLTPRLTREQMRDAIVGPARVCGIEIEPALVNRLLNDSGSFSLLGGDHGTGRLDVVARRADQLPLLQYTLNRMWMLARERSSDAEITMRLADYEAIGGLTGALNSHAEELLMKLGPRLESTAELIFRRLTDGGTLLEAARRPCPFAELVAVCGGNESGAREVIDTFRAPGVNFLVPDMMYLPTLDAATVVDINHESLIRQWRRLSIWLVTEARAARQWRRLLDHLEMRKLDQTGLLRGRELSVFVGWRTEVDATAAWASRYGGDFGSAMALIEESIRAERARRTRLAASQVVAVALLIILGILAWHFMTR